MSSGIRHTIYAIAAGPVVAAGAFYLGCPWQDSIAYGLLEIVGGTLLSPDIDGPCINHRFWFGLFLPYKNWFKHRSFYTHCPAVGSFGRLLYVAALVNLRMFVFRAGYWGAVYQVFDPARYMAEIGDFWATLYAALTWQQAALGFASLSIGEALHSAADYLSSRWKLLRKKHGAIVSAWKIVTFAPGFSGFDWFETAHHK